jgi:hypothetical protein
MYYPVSLLKTICEKVISGEYDINEFSNRLITVCVESGEKYHFIEKRIEKVLDNIERDNYCELPKQKIINAKKYAEELIELIGDEE